ncbi:hypothetical protein AMJ80_01840 [bacterium SM23_31]|nr:MAG: hypothetical protein AMJ80_01840 [bacterium SM23_31]
MNEKLYGSIDIGGTKIRMGLVDRGGNILFRKMFLMPKNKTWEKILEIIVTVFSDMLHEARCSFRRLYGIGIGCPGTFDGKREVISFAPNLKWRSVPIKSFLEERLPAPIWLENDTNLSTIGVAAFGEGKHVNTLIGIFIGTGIGGGIILDKELFIGSTGGAGEVGHMIVKENGPLCNCGNRGCLEAIASTRAIYERIYRQYARRYKEKNIFLDFKNNTDKSHAIKSAYYGGEAIAKKILNQAFFSLGVGIINLINVFNPDMIVFGGGLSETMGDVMIEQVNEVVKQHAMPGTFEEVKIICTGLGEDAPIFGGAALVEMKRNT